MKGMLKRATDSKQRLELIYISNSNEITQRVIKVVVVTESAIKAYCFYKRQFRTFQMANILSIAPVRQRSGAI